MSSDGTADGISAPQLNLQLSTYHYELDRIVTNKSRQLDPGTVSSIAANVTQQVGGSPTAALQSALDDAYSQWVSSGSCAQMKQSLVATPDTDAWMSLMAEELRGPKFAALRHAFATHNASAAVSDDISPVNSCTVTLSLNVELIEVSASFAVVFAMDAIEWTYMTISLSGSVGVGEEVGGSLAECFGASGSTPDQAGGFSVGVQAEATASVGVAGEASVTCDISLAPPYVSPVLEQWSISAGVSQGASVGVGAFVSAAFIFGSNSFPPFAQPEGKYFVRVYAVRCDEIEDSLNCGHDEIWFDIVIDGDWTRVFRTPLWSHYSIAPVNGGTATKDNYWYCEIPVMFNQYFQLRLHQDDHLLKSWNVYPDLPDTQTHDGFDYNYRYHDDSLNEVDYRIMVSYV